MFYHSRSRVAEFENKLKKRFGAKYCIVTSNGTSALKLSLRSLNLKVNDHIIVPSNTFVAKCRYQTI